MPTLSRGNPTAERLCRNAAMLALAMIFSFVEHLLPLSLLIPLPGVKLGLANVVITALFFFASPIDALIVSATRIGLSALLFGTPVSLMFSAMGGLCAYLFLWICRPLYHRVFTFIGVSVLAAAGHHFGQIAAAVILFDSGVLLTYLPMLLLAGTVTGGVTGLLLNLMAPRLQKLFIRGLK